MAGPKTPSRVRLAIAISDRRRAKEMTQSELAQLVGVSRGSALSWEKQDEDNKFPSPEHLDVLANVLGCDVVDLLSEPKAQT